MSISQDYEEYDFTLSKENIVETLEKLKNTPYFETIKIKINGYYYEYK